MPPSSSSSGTSSRPVQTSVEHAEELFTALQNYAGSRGQISVDSPLAPYHTAARWVYCGVYLFADIPKAIRAGMDREHPEKYPKEHHKVYRYLCDRIPQFSSTLREFYKKPERISLLGKMMMQWADSTRNEDTSTLKKNIVSYLAPDPTTTPIIPPLPDNNKDSRGFNHPMTARLLAPRSETAKFDEAGPVKGPELQATMNYIQRVKDATIKLTHTDLSTYLYEEGPYQPSELDRGLLRGHCLIRSYRCLMTGPSSGLSGLRAAAKQSKAEIHELTEVTPETLAYTCVMVRQSLSSTRHWTTKDGTFKYRKFYEFILELLDDDEEPWQDDLITFWNREVPGLQRNSLKRGYDELMEGPDERHEELLDTIFELRRQRQRRANQEGEHSRGSPAPNNNEHHPPEQSRQRRGAQEEEHSRRPPTPDNDEHHPREQSSSSGEDSPLPPPRFRSSRPPPRSQQQQQGQEGRNRAPVAARGGGEGRRSRGGRGGK